jgi:hypothetical protein
MIDAIVQRRGRINESWHLPDTCADCVQGTLER